MSRSQADRKKKLSEAQAAHLAQLLERQVDAARIPVGTAHDALVVTGSVKVGHRWDVEVRCICGVEKSMQKESFRRAKSCGCLTRALISQARTRHGESDTPTWRTWKSMWDRCELRAHKSWPSYGGRGISVCPTWRVYENFRADMGERPAGAQLDRVDNSRGYSPDNCRWATPKQNCNNRRSNRVIEHNGQRLTLSQWAKALGVYPDTLSKRLASGWPLERAMQPTIRFTSASRQGHEITSRMVARGDTKVAEYRLEKPRCRA